MGPSIITRLVTGSRGSRGRVRDWDSDTEGRKGTQAGVTPEIPGHQQIETGNILSPRRARRNKKALPIILVLKD